MRKREKEERKYLNHNGINGKFSLLVATKIDSALSDTVAESSRGAVYFSNQSLLTVTLTDHQRGN